MAKTFDMRDPIYGFITLNDWERDIIDHPVFQRLRRIRQLAWTDMVYPGAMHTRFEHSLGVLHVATRMFDRVVQENRDFLKDNLAFNDDDLMKYRAVIRLASLLHDVGHAPFSHAGEGLLPDDPQTRKPFGHEDYSIAAIEFLMTDVIENHPANANLGVSVHDITDLLDTRIPLGRSKSLFWRQILSSQIDADRADYLLRDSYHAGVAYGRYDLDRVVATLTAGEDAESGAPTLAVEEGGMHVAEGLILARYMMFTQVYFHHTRRAYVFHITQCLSHLIRSQRQFDEFAEPATQFPAPTSEVGIRSYLKWDDWRILGDISKGYGGEHGEILRTRHHCRRVFETVEVPGLTDFEMLQLVQEKLGDLVEFVDLSEKSWYQIGDRDIMMHRSPPRSHRGLVRLSEMSSVVRDLKAVGRRRIYVSHENKLAAKSVLQAFLGGHNENKQR